MEKRDWAALEKQVTLWIKEAAAQLRDSMSQPLEVNEKSAHNDLVTNMDRSIERFLVNRIRTAYPGDTIISEEGYGDEAPNRDGVLWLLDPIDGTLNFVMQRRFFAISIGIYEHGEGRAAFIYDVMGDEFFHCLVGRGAFQNTRRLTALTEVSIDDAMIDISPVWMKANRQIDEEVTTEFVRRCSGIRAYGAASLEMAYVAAGHLDAYFTMRLSPWDYGAGLILLNEVGARCTKADGSPIDILTKTSMLVARPGLHEYMAAHIRNQVREGKSVCEPG